jgi:hypothetical protein
VQGIEVWDASQPDAEAEKLIPLLLLDNDCGPGIPDRSKGFYICCSAGRHEPEIFQKLARGREIVSRQTQMGQAGAGCERIRVVIYDHTSACHLISRQLAGYITLGRHRFPLN